VWLLLFNQSQIRAGNLLADPGLLPSDIETHPCQGGRISGKKGVIATTTGGNVQ
jgi:hypothetical protein